MKSMIQPGRPTADAMEQLRRHAEFHRRRIHRTDAIEQLRQAAEFHRQRLGIVESDDAVDRLDMRPIFRRITELMEAGVPFAAALAIASPDDRGRPR